jgi:hypothetical protein
VLKRTNRESIFSPLVLQLGRALGIELRGEAQKETPVAQSAEQMERAMGRLRDRLRAELAG